EDDSYGYGYPDRYVESYPDAYSGDYDYGYYGYGYPAYDYWYAPYPFFFVGRDGFVHRFRGRGHRFCGHRGFDWRGFRGRGDGFIGRGGSGDSWRSRDFRGRRGNTIVVGPRRSGHPTFARGFGPGRPDGFRGSRGGPGGHWGSTGPRFSSGPHFSSGRSGGGFGRGARTVTGPSGGSGRRQRGPPPPRRTGFRRSMICLNKRALAACASLALASALLAAPEASGDLAARLDRIFSEAYPATGPGAAVIVVRDGKTIL